MGYIKCKIEILIVNINVKNIRYVLYENIIIVILIINAIIIKTC